MSNASILSFVKQNLTELGGYTIMAVSQDKTLLGELWQFRGHGQNVMRLLVKPDGTVIPSVNGQPSPHQRLESLPPKDGSYLIQVRLKKVTGADTLASVVTRLQTLCDEGGVAGWFQVFDSEDHMTVVFDRNVSDDVECLIPWHKDGLDIPHAACRQLGKELKEAAPHDDHLMAALWSMLMDTPPKAQIIDPDEVLKDLGTALSWGSKAPGDLDQNAPNGVQFDADSVLNFATQAAVQAAREAFRHQLRQHSMSDDPGDLPQHDLQVISQVMGRFLAQALGQAIDGCATTAPECTVQMGQWQVTFSHDEPRRLNVRRNDEPGDIHLKADVDGYVVDFYSDTPIPDVVGSSWCYYEEMKADVEESPEDGSGAADADPNQPSAKVALS